MTDQAIAPAQAQAPSFSLVPSSYEDAIRISKTLAASQLVPKDYQGKPENVFVAIAWGQELGLQPLQSLQNIAVINGRPAIWGDAALAICSERPDFEDIVETLTGEGEKRVATCTIKRRGRSPVVRTFSVADAKQAGLWSKSGPWQQYPERMLQLRARGFALRDAFPDAMRGFKTAEEVADIEEKDVTPQRPAVVMPKASAPAAEQQQAETVNTETGEISEQRNEDLPTEPAGVKEPLEGVPSLSTGQLKVIRSKLTAASLEEADLCAAFDVPRLEAIAATSVNSCLDWIKGKQA